MHLDAPFRQLGRHHVAGALLLEAEFGMGVQVAPPFGHLRRELGDAVDDRHEVLRVAGERRAEYRAVGLLLQPDTQPANRRSEEHTSELQSLMRISYAVFCLKKKTNKIINNKKH